MDARSIDPVIEINEWSWNRLCWYGTLNRQAMAVMKACEQAVTLDPSNIYFRVSRGLARAMTGDSDGAIQDLQQYIKNSNDDEWNGRIQGWIDALERGEAPVTEEDLEELRQE